MAGMPALALQKAILRVVDGTPGFLLFKFNPTEYSLTRSAKWNQPATTGAQNAPPAQYTGPGEPMSIDMTLFFDEFESADKDVMGDVNKLLTWTKPDPLNVRQNKAQPPLLTLEWGGNPALDGFKGYLSSVNAKYSMFRVDGRAIRATATIKLQEQFDQPAGQNPTSGSLESTGSHILIEGESLHSVAHAEYGIAAYWRGLAVFNDIDDPLRLRAGRRLLIPSPEEAARLS